MVALRITRITSVILHQSLSPRTIRNWGMQERSGRSGQGYSRYRLNGYKRDNLTTGYNVTERLLTIGSWVQAKSGLSSGEALHYMHPWTFQAGSIVVHVLHFVLLLLERDS